MSHEQYLERLKNLDELTKKRDRLRKIAFRTAKSFTCDDIEATSFDNWFHSYPKHNHPDAIRNWLYFGFQPLLDGLIAGSKELPVATRKNAIRLLDRLIQLNKNYLTGYYLSTPTMFDDQISELKWIDQISRVIPYEKKFRNVDFNCVYPKDIFAFLLKMVDLILEGTIPYPDYIVGCACGASEIVMPLAGILDVDIHFIRFSKRRYDENAKAIAAHKRRFRIFENAIVLCGEDMVCTGRSISTVMKEIAKYNPRKVYGVSVSDSHEGKYATRLGQASPCNFFGVKDVACSLKSVKFKNFKRPIIGVIGAGNPHGNYDPLQTAAIGSALREYVGRFDGTILTGGVEGVGLHAYMGIIKHCMANNLRDDRFVALIPEGHHITTKDGEEIFFPYYLPESYEALAFVSDIPCKRITLGKTMSERRVFIAQVIDFAVMINGGHGTLDEAAYCLHGKKPVIAVQSGGTTTTLIQMKNGLLSQKSIRNEHYLLVNADFSLIHQVSNKPKNIIQELGRIIAAT